MSKRKVALFITLMTLISKAFGFVREAIIAYFFGTSTEVDAYLMAISIPSILFGFLATIAPAYMVLYTEIREKKDERAADGYTTYLVVLLGIMCLICIVIGMFFSPQIVQIMAPGYEGYVFSLTINYFRIAVWDTLFLTLLNIYVAFLQCNDRFSYAAFAMLFHSSMQIVFTIIAGFTGAIFLIYGYVFADITYFLVVFIWSVKQGHKFIFNGNCTDEIKRTLKLAIPMFISGALTQINAYVDKSFASMLDTGSISSLYYANILKTFIIMMLNTGVITILYPILAKLAVQKNFVELKIKLVESVRYSLMVFLPATIGVILVAENIVELLFGRGSFGTDSIEITSKALIMYVIGMTAIGLRDILLKYHYAIQDTKKCMWISAINIGVNIILNFLLIGSMGYRGLALSTSLAAIITIPLYYPGIKSTVGNIVDSKFFIFIAKLIISCIIMTMVILSVKKYIFLNNYQYIIIVVILGTVSYGSALVFLKVEEAENSLSNIKCIIKNFKQHWRK